MTDERKTPPPPASILERVDTKSLMNKMGEMELELFRARLAVADRQRDAMAPLLGTHAEDLSDSALLRSLLPGIEDDTKRSRVLTLIARLDLLDGVVR